MYEVIIFASFIVIFTAAFMLALSALFYSLATFTSGEVKKLNDGRDGSDLIISLGKVFAVSFIGFSFFVYTMSFFLRIGNDALRQQKLERTGEYVSLSEKPPLLSRGENPNAPLFDFLIQSAARQSEKKQVTSIAVFGGIFGLSAILTMALYIIYRMRNEKYNDGKK